MRQELNPFTLAMLLGLAVLGVYYPSIFSPVNSVDDSGMLHYLLNCDSFSWRRIFVPGGSGSYYRPILLSSFMMDKYVWGLHESFMHLENVVFHLINTLMVYAVGRRAMGLLNENSALLPFVAALLFAVHPLNTEAVNWISGRTDLLAAFFLLLSTYIILHKELRWCRVMISAVCMLLACLAKETAIFFLPAALLFPFFISGNGRSGSLRSLLRSYGIYLIIFCLSGAAYFAFRMLAFSKGDQGISRVVTHVGGSESSGLLLSTRLVLKATGFYAKKLFVPFPLNFGITHVSDLYLPLGVVVMFAVVWLIIRRTLPVFFIVTAAAVGSSALMIPLLRLTWTPLAERYMYIPSAFLLLGISLSFRKLGCKQKYGTHLTLAVSLVIMIAIYGTATRNILWQDNLALYEDTLRKSPDFIPAQNEIANALYCRGKTEEAITIYKSFDEPNGLVNAQYGLKNKAFALMHEGRFTEARDIMKQLLANPGKHEIQILLQLLELNKVQVMANKATNMDVYAESVTTLNRLVEITGDPFYSYRLGIVHMQAGARDKAHAEFLKVVKTAPKDIYYRKPSEKLVIELSK